MGGLFSSRKRGGGGGVNLPPRLTFKGFIGFSYNKCFMYQMILTFSINLSEIYILMT